MSLVKTKSLTVLCRNSTRLCTSLSRPFVFSLTLRTTRSLRAAIPSGGSGSAAARDAGQ